MQIGSVTIDPIAFIAWAVLAMLGVVIIRRLQLMVGNEIAASAGIASILVAILGRGLIGVTLFAAGVGVCFVVGRNVARLHGREPRGLLRLPPELRRWPRWQEIQPYAFWLMMIGTVLFLLRSDAQGRIESTILPPPTETERPTLRLLIMVIAGSTGCGIGLAQIFRPRWAFNGGEIDPEIYVSSKLPGNMIWCGLATALGIRNLLEAGSLSAHVLAGACIVTFAVSWFGFLSRRASMTGSDFQLFAAWLCAGLMFVTFGVAADRHFAADRSETVWVELSKGIECDLDPAHHVTPSRSSQ